MRVEIRIRAFGRRRIVFEGQPPVAGRRVRSAGAAAAALAIALSTGAGPVVQSSAYERPGAVRRAGAVAPAGRVTGTAWDAGSQPLPRARLRLRDVATGRLAATSVADELGRFRFERVAIGEYVVEVVNGDGGVLALSQLFSVTDRDTTETLVRLPSLAPWFDDFFTNTTTAAVAAASALGITEVGPTSLPLPQ